MINRIDTYYRLDAFLSLKAQKCESSQPRCKNQAAFVWKSRQSQAYIWTTNNGLHTEQTSYIQPL